MKTPQNILLFTRNLNKRPVTETDSDIIDDSALIDCMNQLNSLREAENEIVVASEQDAITKINQVNAEMRWFSQWLTVKSNSAA